MNTELIKIPSYNKILEAVREFYGDNEIKELFICGALEGFSCSSIKVKASTFAKPVSFIVKRTAIFQGKVTYICFDNFQLHSSFPATTYKASPDKAFSFNPISKEFKIIENE